MKAIQCVGDLNGLLNVECDLNHPDTGSEGPGAPKE